MVFISKNKVRMHDTDMAGILYFARQFRFAHDALEDFCESKGLNFDQVFHKEHFVFVIVHAEADYYKSVKVGDALDVHLNVENIGNSSFTFFYEIFRNKELIGTCRTVHCTLDTRTRQKIPIPERLIESLKEHLITQK